MCANKAPYLSQNLAKTGLSGYVKAQLLLRYYADYYKIPLRLLQNSARTRTVSWIRTEIGNHLAAETDLSLAEIAQLIGRKRYRRPTNEKGK